MSRIRDLIDRIAPRETTVLVRGETGTGKELIARSIHEASKRASGPFIPVDCTGLNDSLIEAQLFGHVKGAFTGASTDSTGFIRAANKGTVFLDEVGELPASAQAKLLRCVQEKSVVPVGGTHPIAVDFRLVAATHRDLKQMVDEGKFREDLYYRLSVVQMQVPALREREGDIQKLVAFFLEDIADIYGEPAKLLTDRAMALLLMHDWPGNVRELQNAIEHAFVLAGDATRIDVGHLPEPVRRPLPPQPAGDEQEQYRRLFDSARGQVTHSPAERNNIAARADELSETTQPSFDGQATGPHRQSDLPDQQSPMPTKQPLKPLAEVERQLIARALLQTEGNQSAAARLLKVERHRLRRLIQRHDLQDYLTR
jgi:transcriptional regulator with PAS, ATPase and Fis domain